MDPLTCCCRAMCGHLIFFRHALAAAMGGDPLLCSETETGLSTPKIFGLSGSILLFFMTPVRSLVVPTSQASEAQRATSCTESVNYGVSGDKGY